MKKIALVEVFRAPQGEGYNAGRQAIFVRTAGCNLSCVFAGGSVCDTPYQKAAMKVTIEELMGGYVYPLMDFIWPIERENYGRMEDRIMFVITGGEPTTQPLFDELVQAASTLGFYVAVETNGTRFREGLRKVDWICVSPKEAVAQGSLAQFHNHNPQSAALDPDVVGLLEDNDYRASAEYRYVIVADSPAPPYLESFRHYLSPAVMSDGSGEEWKTGNFPGFVPGAVARCLELQEADPRWRISIQSHKILGVR